MAQLTVQTRGLAGTTITTAAANAGGDTFANDGNTSLKVTNGGGAAITVTVKAQQPCNLGSLHDDVVNVGAGTTVDVGPFSAGRFNDSNGNVTLQYSSVTSVTVGVYR